MNRAQVIAAHRVICDPAYFRTARKEYGCHGGHDGQKRVKCLRPILPGTVYVEYCGEGPIYSSGQRFHLECAEQQKIIEKVEATCATS